VLGLLLNPSGESVDVPVNRPAQPRCAARAVKATSAPAVTRAVSAGKDVCVTTPIGDLELVNLGNRAGVVISTDGGSIGHLEINGTSGLLLDSARLRSVTIRAADHTKIENSRIGGTAADRVLDQLIFMPETLNGIVIRSNDIGWTEADDSGNTGYGCRCYGTLNRLRFVGNKLHDLAGDGFQGVGGSNVLIDRNEIGPVGANPDSNEHSDNIQITGNGRNLRITNNWIHDQGYYGGRETGNAGSVYIHGGTSDSLLFENNLIESNRGRTEIQHHDPA
jgi:Right handed beta helix region